MSAPRIVVEDSTGTMLDRAGDVTFGTKSGDGIVVDDAIAAPRHCRFAHDGRFVVHDLGTVTGTWVDGRRVDGPTEVVDGATIVFGSARLLAQVGERAGAPLLTLTLQRGAFWWRKPGKKVFDNDPDALVRSEIGFGRFPLLHVANRLALLAAAVLLLGGAFVGALLEPLADPGPLLPSHALVASDTPVDGAHAAFAACRALADAQGCNVCHATGEGAPEHKCMQCHDDLRAEASRRHPYVRDGVLGEVAGMAVGQDFCVLCHVDHQGSDWLKPASASLVGNCEACHGPGQQRDALARQAPPQVPPPRQREHTTIHFPHAPHVEQGIDCRVCHTLDPDVRARHDAGFPDDPDRHDFAAVPYETCASCHVDGAPLHGMTAAQRETWQAKAPAARWQVAWHGTDDSGARCKACHVEHERDGVRTIGPEPRTVPRPALTVAEHAAERARYTVPRRSHAEQFAAHADGRACTQCHLAGSIDTAAANAAAAAKPFWHALHLAPDALAPATGAAGAVSTDAAAGCASCHADLARAAALTDARVAAYHWPTTPAAQAACGTCHREGERQLALTAAATTFTPARIAAARAAPDFPHDVHVGSASFGKSGALVDGCFACHVFERAPDGAELAAVPRTLPAAADCTQCHAGHAHVGGGDCEQCHPAARDRSNSFLAAARVVAGTTVRGRPAPAAPTRAWPAQNGFRHLSRGHADVDCATCHDPALVGTARDLASVPVPDDATTACRECHLQKQFHWR